MAFPDITLATPFICQREISASDVHIIQKDVNVDGKSLRVFCQVGTDPSCKYWVPVQEGETFNIDWTNADIEKAVLAYFVNPVPAPTPDPAPAPAV